MSDKIRSDFWGHQMADIVKEIVREATICKVRLLDPGVVEAVLHGNASVCGADNPVAFKKLRDLLMMGFVVREKAVDRLGPLEAEEIGREIRELDRLEGSEGADLQLSIDLDLQAYCMERLADQEAAAAVVAECQVAFDFEGVEQVCYRVQVFRALKGASAEPYFAVGSNRDDPGAFRPLGAGGSPEEALEACLAAAGIHHRRRVRQGDR